MKTVFFVVVHKIRESIFKGRREQAKQCLLVLLCGCAECGAMFGEDLEAESLGRKERISRLVGGLQARQQQEKIADSARARQPSTTGEVRIPPPVAASTSTARYRREEHNKSPPRPTRRVPPAVPPHSPVKERVAATLIEQCKIDERAKQRRERAAVLQKAAESRVRKHKEDERRQQQSKLIEEESKLLQYQFEHKLHLNAAALKETAQEENVRALKGKRLRAEAFRRKQILVRWGLVPLIRIGDIARNNWFTAVNYSDDALLQQAWVALYGFCANQKRERIRRESRPAFLAVSH